MKSRIKRKEFGAFCKIKNECIEIFDIHAKIKLLEIPEYSKKIDVSE